MYLLKNDLLLRALKGQKNSRPPVWMMRQAGRYLPEYRRLREKYSFLERIQTPELACEITLQPVDIIGVDAAILFSDILVIPMAMGMEVQLVPDKGPVLSVPVRGEKDLQRIGVPDIQDRLHYVFEAIHLVKQELQGRVPLIGFAGAPWTILCYMIEGCGSKNFSAAKAFCYRQPELAHHLLEMITQSTIVYLKAQISAGVNVIQLFDSWAGLLGKQDFEIFALPYLKQIVGTLNKETPVIIFAKGAWHSLKEIAQTGVQGISIDWNIPAGQARKFAGGEVTLQGNLDPAKLFAPIPQLKKEVQKMLTAFGKDKYIANLGHGILPNVPVDHAKAFIEEVKNYEW